MMAFRQPSLKHESAAAQWHGMAWRHERKTLLIVWQNFRTHLSSTLSATVAVSIYRYKETHTQQRTKFFAQKLVLFERILCERFSCRAQCLRHVRAGSRRTTNAAIEKFQFHIFREWN